MALVVRPEGGELVLPLRLRLSGYATATGSRLFVRSNHSSISGRSLCRIAAEHYEVYRTFTQCVAKADRAEVVLVKGGG